MLGRRLDDLPPLRLGVELDRAMCLRSVGRTIDFSRVWEGFDSVWCMSVPLFFDKYYLGLNSFGI